jgi:hypothetical protein
MMKIYDRFGDHLKHRWNRARVRVRRPYFLAVDALKGGLNYGASIASVLTLGADPTSGILHRMTHGPIQSAKGLYRLAEAYGTNVGIRDFTTGAFSEGGRVFINGVENIIQHPVDTAIAALGTYAALRIGRAILNGVETVRIDRHVERLYRRSPTE